MMNRTQPKKNTVMKRSLHHMPIAVGLVSLLALSGCGDRQGVNSQTPVDEDQLVESMPASDTAVDEVTWSIIEGEPATLDPTSSANLIIPNLCDNLLSLQPDFSVEPGLATSAEWKDDTTFIIDLRDDVTFWDGSEMTRTTSSTASNAIGTPNPSGMRPSRWSRTSRPAATTRSPSPSTSTMRTSAMPSPDRPEP
jgi:ABC-type transport system substrate-binding protein